MELESRVLIATSKMADWANDSFESAKAIDNLAGWNYAIGLMRACAIAAEALGGNAEHWEEKIRYASGRIGILSRGER